MTLFNQVQQDTVDEHQLAQEIAKKLGDTPGISYTEIATKAYDRGKSSLAIKVFIVYIFSFSPG